MVVIPPWLPSFVRRGWALMTLLMERTSEGHARNLRADGVVVREGL